MNETKIWTTEEIIEDRQNKFDNVFSSNDKFVTMSDHDKEIAELKAENKKLIDEIEKWADEFSYLNSNIAMMEFRKLIQKARRER